MTRAIVLVALLGAACGDAKAPSGGKAEVELPAKRDAPTKAETTPDDKAAAIAKADAKVETKAEATPDAKASPDTGEAKAAPTEAGGEIGVAECDAYLTKYSKCIDTGVPAEIKELMRGAVENSREAWKKAAAGSERAGLPAICKGALAAAKNATSKYGCAW